MKGNFLKAARIKVGLSPQEMADLIGKTRQAYYNKENGLSRFTRDEIDLISKALGLTPEETWVIFFEDEFPLSQREMLLKAIAEPGTEAEGSV